MEWIQSVVGCSKTCKQQQEMAQTQTNHQKPAHGLRRTHKRVTLPPAQFSPEPIQFDDAANRGHAVMLLHPEKNRKKKKKR
jgi:hypothetical protein